MQIQDYDSLIKRLEGIVRRADMFNQTREDVLMNVRFFAEDLQLAQRLEEEKMIKELMPS